MLEGRFVSFLVAQMETKANALPMSQTQQDLVALVTELRGAVDAIFAAQDGAKRRSGARRSSSGSVRLSRGEGEA
ncbi:hypothetical protein [Alicyclobacillus sp. ALC3]|uniref:hypothetical protein n=1 Tax=Alicyclobacillus sp. ALC3 TaxID=2796143 RepID=UPI002379BAC7|nr:hypothetical protein [Alicyclobacillus sp. ALC3]WDL97783.1 hypothetical protein JC200_03370 [Alicyclobacillus sp. ALC3]